MKKVNVQKNDKFIFEKHAGNAFPQSILNADFMGVHRISRKKVMASDISPQMSVISALNHVGRANWNFEEKNQRLRDELRCCKLVLL